MASDPASNIRTRTTRTTSALAGVVRRVGGRVAPGSGRRFYGTDPRPSGHSIRRINVVAVSISYEPQADAKPDPGEVVWVWIPYEEDPSVGKDRPALAVGWVPATPQDDIAVVPLTSRWHAGQVSVGLGAWDGGRKRSFAKVDQIYVVDRADVRREGASLHKSVFEQVIRALTG
jgi:mRNA-degrading endonuclease toxin of MazEF toxin-antitoxin module